MKTSLWEYSLKYGTSAGSFLINIYNSMIVTCNIAIIQLGLFGYVGADNSLDLVLGTFQINVLPINSKFINNTF